MEYVQHVSRIRDLARTYWFDVLIALLAIVAMLEVVLGRGSPGAPTTTLWFCLPALAILVLPCFARRRFPFAGPAAYWLLAAGISFVDPLLIPYAEALFPIGMADAFLLGNLRDVRRAGLGLAVVVGGCGDPRLQHPRTLGQPARLHPARVRRSAGSRALPCASGPSRPRRRSHVRPRPSRSGMQRRAIAVAEERTRIARELHDIVAHAVSVMVLQVGAVRHQLPDAMAEDRDALRSVEQAGRARAGGDAPSARRDAP